MQSADITSESCGSLSYVHSGPSQEYTISVQLPAECIGSRNIKIKIGKGGLPIVTVVAIAAICSVSP